MLLFSVQMISIVRLSALGRRIPPLWFLSFEFITFFLTQFKGLRTKRNNMIVVLDYTNKI